LGVRWIDPLVATEVRRIVAWLTRCGRCPGHDLVRTVAADVDDDSLIVLLPHSDLLASVVVGHRVTRHLRNG
jgi:hypothetical protein